MNSRLIGGSKRKLFGRTKMEEGGILSGGIGTAGVLSGGARDFVSRLDGGAKKMMMELKDKSDGDLKQLYHDLGKSMFHSIRRVIEEEMGIQMKVDVKPKSKSKKSRDLKRFDKSVESKPMVKRQSRGKKKETEIAPEPLKQMEDTVKEQMVNPVPKVRRVVVKRNPQAKILESGNPVEGIPVEKPVNAPGQSVPTRAEIIQSVSGSGKPKRQLGDKMKKRAEAVKRLMKEKGMKLGEASSYLKSHPEEI